MVKVVVIGLDGATWRLMEPWLKSGDLPNLGKLYNNGVYAKLESTIPPLTPPAWTSAFTGVNPGKHNIFDFVYYDGYEKKIVFNYHRKHDCLWNYLHEYGKKSIVVNVPGTYPPEKINGIMISGMGTPSIKSDFVYPDELKSMLIKNKYIIEYGSVREWADNKKNFISRIKHMSNIRRKIISYLMTRYDWDLFISVFTSIDRVQHIFWKTDNNGSILQEDYRILYSTYLHLDEICGEIINNVGSEAYVFIISDHGFGPIQKGIYINNYLRELGFLDLKRNQKKATFSKLGLTQTNLVKIASKLDEYGLRKIVSLVPNKVRSKIFFETGMGLVDWTRTIAWYGTTSGHAIYINLQGRQPNGIVNPKQYNSICDRIIHELYKLKDPSSGARVIKKCYKRKEIYNGPYLENAPDIVIEPEEGYSLQEGFSEEVIEYAKEGSVRRYGDHEKYGIFMCKGPEIKKGFKINDVRIIDVAPTILHIFGCPIPDDVDGRCLKEIFEEDSEFFKREVVYNHVSQERERVKKIITNLKSKVKL